MVNISEKLDQPSSQERVLLALKQARVKLEALESSKTEPIAIIGMSCRFPGGANDPESFWQLLRDGVDVLREVPSNRWDINTYYDANPDTPGKMYTRWGMFLDTAVDSFDAQFFGITPREAVSMDPQQRLLLEVSWEALERAGIAPDQLNASPTGVFVGINTSDYAQLQSIGTDVSQLSPYFFTGNTLSVAAGRLSYILGLQGPTMSVDTACSSSLVGVHLAIQSLRLGECRLALAGGVNLMLSSQTSIVLSRMRALAADGRCKTFEADADGYGRGEGCGVIVLKRLTDALADGDNILALIRGSAVNHDGLSSGLTVPNGLAQQNLIRTALINAKVKPNQVSYVEVHGTGTALGDPIEVEALGMVLRQGRSHDEPVLLGAVKRDIGHLEAASGIASLIKVVLAMQHKELLPNHNLKQLNPAISWENLPVVIPTQISKWSVTEGQSRFAGVSSFGMSGTNAHIILEEAPTSPTKLIPDNQERPLCILTLSAKNEEALKQLIVLYQNYLAANPCLSLADICFTANTGRSHFPYRWTVVAESSKHLQEELANCTNSQIKISIFAEQVASKRQPQIAFLFTGQGCQYVEMGRQLYKTQPTFRKALDKCNEILRSYLDQPLLSVLYPEAAENALLDQTAYTQPALFAVEYGLYKLWQSWGIEPSAVMGHSVGEYVAACVAGVFSLEDALKLIATRGSFIQALPQNGAMVSVVADIQQVKQAIRPYGHKISLAAINGAESIVISGERQAINKVVTDLNTQGIKTKQLVVSHAFHSPLMEPILEEFLQIASQVSYSQPTINVISNVTGKLASNEITTPEYWCQHIRQPVNFLAGMTTLHEQGYEIFIECGPKPILLGLGRQCLPSDWGVWLPSLRAEKSDWQQLLQSLGELYVRGVKIDWLGFDQDYVRRKVGLPTYPFQRQRYWIDSTPQEHHSVNGSLTNNLPTLPILNFLQQGDIQELAQHLQTSGTFSEVEVELLPKLLQVFAKQYRNQVNAATVNDWLYELKWQLQPRQADYGHQLVQTHESGMWLIFADQAGLGKVLADNLQQQGRNCLLVYRDEVYSFPETGVLHLNPSRSEDFERLFQDFVTPSQLPLTAVVYLWSLDTTTTKNLTIESLEQEHSWTCGSVLYLLQSLVKRNQSTSPQIWLVTRGAMPVNSDIALAVNQASLWGLGKVLADEHPEFWGGMLDLDPAAPTDEVGTLLTEIGNSQRENNLAFREEKRYALRLVRSYQSELQELSLRADSTYLITGGLGALGLKVAQWMVEQGARNLVLIGRREASSEVRATLNQLQEAGAQIQVTQADVSSQESMRQVLQELQASMPPLRGIIHTAGIISDGVLIRQNWEQFNQVLEPKIKGAWNLHTLTQDISLDFFVLFSSATSFLGSPGQGNYATANFFLDALAHYRKMQGLPALSINWGPWAEVGMTARMSSRDQSRLAAKGLNAMTTEQGLQVLQHVLQCRFAQVGVFSIRWSDWFKQYPVSHRPPYFLEIASEIKQAVPEVEKAQQETIIFEQLIEAPSDERKAIITSYLQQQISEVLQLDSSQIQVFDNLVEIGMDSLMVMETINHLQQNLKLMLYPREFYERPKIEALGKYLTAEFERVHGQANIQKYESAVLEPTTLLDSRSLIQNLQITISQRERLPSPVYILSAPRSGSTLLRVMLAGHPSLFSPPELHLLPFATMAERQNNLSISYLGEGLQRAFIELLNIDGATSQALVDEMVSQNLSIQEVYAMLQELASTRQLVDKSPTYATSRDILERAEELFQESKYIYLTRHPYAMIESFVRMRMDKLIGAGEVDPYKVAEDIWTSSNQNILDFFRHSVAPERYCHIRYEDLVKKPIEQMESLCQFLNIPFVPELLNPYEGKRMTDGVYMQSMPIGDPNFLKYNKLDPTLGDAWKKIQLPYQLGESTRDTVAKLEYELSVKDETKTVELNKLDIGTPALVSPSNSMSETYLDIRGHRFCLSHWGAEERPIVLCLHGLLEQGAAWEKVALPLVDKGYRVIAPDLRGHGRSSHVKSEGCPNLLNYLADVNAIVENLPDRPLTLVGHSLGSIVAAMFTSARPQKVETLALIETVLPGDGNDQNIVEQISTYLDYLSSPPKHPIFADVATAAMRLRQSTPAMSEEFSLKLAKRITEPVNGGVRWRWDSLLQTRTILSFSGMPFGKAKYMELLRQIKVPITLVYGDKSNFNRTNDLSEQKAAMPQAKRVFLSGGHNLHIDAPEALANIIVDAGAK
ncbi:alpha/beta fold hydrolase [Nostocales cyanobacterium LEGE 11386]|nr:alpha/beta fold hydrolase [Nostocales cyanobacterium LEGE 11386]